MKSIFYFGEVCSFIFTAPFYVNGTQSTLQHRLLHPLTHAADIDTLMTQLKEKFRDQRLARGHFHMNSGVGTRFCSLLKYQK